MGPLHSLPMLVLLTLFVLALMLFGPRNRNESKSAAHIWSIEEMVSLLEMPSRSIAGIVLCVALRGACERLRQLGRVRPLRIEPCDEHVLTHLSLRH